MADLSTTPRGFSIYDQFTDTYGATIRVQESSAATEPKVWIFAEGGAVDNPSPHLNVEQAIRLRSALGEFIAEHGSSVLPGRLMLLGQRVRVTLDGQVVHEGKLLGISEDGGIELQGDDGAAWYGWPALNVVPAGEPGETSSTRTGE